MSAQTAFKHQPEHVVQSPDMRREMVLRHEAVAAAAASANANANAMNLNMNSPSNNKRKRDVSEQHVPMGNAGAGAGGSAIADGAMRSSYKRVAANHPAALTVNDQSTRGHDVGDPSGNSFMPGQPTSSGAGNGDEDIQQPSNASLEFSQLAQHQNGTNSHTGQHNGTSGPGDATSTAAAALAGIYPTMTIPQPTGLSFANDTTGADSDRALDPSFAMTDRDGSQQQHDGGSFALEGQQQSSGRESSGSQKPAVGSDEWHRVRRDNHKEVERRRRETINEGINELAKIVPGCEKNKGSILQRAVSFITQLKENEAQNIEKWTLEKLLTEQAIQELSSSVDKMKQECERAWREAEMWKRTCENAGLMPRKDEPGSSNGVQDGGA